MNKYVGKKEALKILGMSAMTLLKMEKENKIEIIKTIGGHRKYNVEKFINDNKKESEKIEKTENVKKEKDEEKESNKKKERKNICYIRVSTVGQKSDLEHQKAYMKGKYKDYEIIEDIGSGINFNRKGLKKIIKLGINGNINKLVVAYKDRLTRFGFELIEEIIKEYSNGEIIIENDKKIKEPEEELVYDVLEILNVYTAKMNGLRKYKNKKDNKIETL
jgi:predicted site-specific integrase-resolvase